MMRTPGAPADRADATVELGRAAPARTAAAPEARPGDAVGRYIVIDELGRGAMGVVLRAYDPRLQREIALKRLHRRAITDDDHARVVREARALAKIAHPNVVGIFDVEELGDSVTLVMEHVRGVPMTRWLERPHGPREILGVLIDVGTGLSAAHAEGILHRDVKPANVIVGDDGRARILDFGLARPGVADTTPPDRGSGASGPASGDSDALTRAGTVMGTPSYMAPEQHASSDLTPAADQFAFCVMAWESLVGERPFVADSYEALAASKRSGPPPWPRHVAKRLPTRVVEAVRRGLAPDPTARWPTMGDLLAALAFDPTRRRRQLSWAGLTIAAAAGTYAIARGEAVVDARCTGAQAQLAGVWDDTQRERAHAAVIATELPFAAAAWTTTAAQLDAYAGEWTQMHQANCEATAIRHEQSESAMDLRMACLDRTRRALGAIGNAMTAADLEMVGRLGAMLDTLPPLSRCADVAALEADADPPAEDEAEAVASLRTLVADAAVQRLAGKYEAAVETMSRARADAETLSYEPVLAEVLVELGQDLEVTGDWKGAEATLRSGFELALSHGQREQAKTAAIALVAILGDRLDRYPEAHAFASAARGLVGRESDDVRGAAALRSATSQVLNSEGDFARSEELLRGGVALLTAELPADAREVLDAKTRLAIALRLGRRFDEARTLAQEILDTKTQLLGPDHPELAETLAALAKTNLGADREVEAEAQARRALSIRMRALGPEHPETAESRQQLGTILKANEKYAEAETELVAAVATFSRLLGPNHARIAGAKLSLSEVLRATSRKAEARALLAEAATMFQVTLGPDHLSAALPKHVLAQLMEAEGDLEGAEREEREALRIMVNHHHPVVPDLEISLAEILYRRKQYVAALPFAERGYESRRNATPNKAVWASFVLAKVLWEAGGDRERALTLARSCQALATGGEVSPSMLDEVAAWLAERQR